MKKIYLLRKSGAFELKTPLNSQLLGAMPEIWLIVVNAVISRLKKTGEENFDPWKSKHLVKCEKKLTLKKKEVKKRNG